MLKLKLLLVLVLFCTTIEAQTWKWAKIAGGSQSDEAADLAIDDNDNLYAVGTFTAPAQFGSLTLSTPGHTSFVVKYDSTGSVIWANSFPGLLQKITIDPNNNDNFIAAGIFSGSLTIGSTVLTSNGLVDCFAFRFNAQGIVSWSTSWGGNDVDALNDIEYQQSGNWVVTGTFNSTTIFFKDNVSLNQTYPLTLTSAGTAANLYAAHFRNNDGKIILAKGGSISTGSDRLNMNLETDMRGSLGLNVLKGDPNQSGSAPPVTVGSSNVPFIYNVLELDSSLNIYRNLVNENSYTVPPSGGNYTFWLQFGKSHLDRNGDFYLVKSWAYMHWQPPGAGRGRDEYVLATNIHKLSILPSNNQIGCILCDFPVSTIPFGVYENRVILNRRLYSNVNSPYPFDANMISLHSGSQWYKYYGVKFKPATMLLNSRGNKVYMDGLYSGGSDSLFSTASGTDRINVSGIGGNDAYFVLLNLPNQTLKADAGNDKSLCTGSNGVYLGGYPAAIGGTKGPYTYSWQPLSGLNNATIPYPLANPSSTTIYTLTVTDGNGNVSSDQVTVSVNQPLPIPVITASGPLISCGSNSLTLTAPTGYSYYWSTGETTRSITVNTAGSYTVTVFLNNCSSISAPANVVIGSPPVPVIGANGPSTFCQGGGVILTAPPGYTYLWSNGATSQNIYATTGGNYTVTVSLAPGCSATSLPYPVTVLPSPNIYINSSSSPTFCQGGSVTFTGPPGYTYLWSTGATTQSIIITTSGSYTLTITDANGCRSSTTGSVTVFPLPAVPVITATGNTTICSGGSVILSTPVVANHTYLWSNGATTPSITVNTAGVYTVTIKNNTNCTATSLPVTVTVNSVPVPVISASGPVSFCQGGSVNLSAPSGFTYLWNTGATTQSINVSASGNYSVTVTNLNGCSSSSAATSVTVNPLPAIPVVTTSGPIAFCQGGNVTLTAPAGFSYQWSTGATTQSINVTSTGNYSVTVTNANGCTRTSVATTVTVNPLPVVPIITQVGNTLTSSSATTYQWYFNGVIIPGATSQDYTYSTGGDFTVTVTNAFGCSSTSQVYTAPRNEFVLLNNTERFYYELFPNPVSTNLTINYQLEQSHNVSIRLIDINGRIITIQNAVMRNAGRYSVNANAIAERIWKGVYILEFTIDNKKASRVIVKL